MTSPNSPSISTVATIYGDHNNWLQGWLRRRLGNTSDAADLAQDVFVRLLVKPRGFDSTTEARAFLRTVADGLCIDLWRRRELERAWMDVLRDQPATLVPSLEEQAIILRALHDIDKILASLPHKAASAFVMAVGCDMTDREVAQALGVSTRMVRKYVTQAMLHCMRAEARQQRELQALGQQR